MQHTHTQPHTIAHINLNTVHRIVVQIELLFAATATANATAAAVILVCLLDFTVWLFNSWTQARPTASTKPNHVDGGSLNTHCAVHSR